MRLDGTRRPSFAPLVAAWLCTATLGLRAQTLTFTPVGSIALPAQLIKVEGETAYLANASTLTIVDISNPAAPATLGAYTFPDQIWGFRVAGRMVYVAADRFGLGILDVSNGRTPVLRGSLKMKGQAKNVAVSGATAVVTDSVSGLNVVDVSNPAKPVHVGSAYLEGFATDVAISGTLAYAADRPTGFYVFDVSKKGALEPVGALQSATPNNAAGQQVEVLPAPANGPRVVVLVAAASLQLFDVSSPGAPVPLPPFRTPGMAQRLALKNQTAYVAAAGQGLQVVDLSNPSTPRIVGAFRTASPARDVAITDSLVLLALGGGEVSILRQVP